MTSLKSIMRANTKTKTKKDTKVDSKSDSDTIESSDYNSNNIKLNDLINPCIDKILYTKIILHPNQMNNDLYMNLKKNLIDKLENKCISDGYVIKIYKIIDYTNGIIEAENLTGAAIFNVKYLARICVALKETTIIGKITEYIPNANFALAEFGNIMKIIFTKNERDLNTRVFTINSDKSITHIQSQRKLQVGDFVRLQLKTIRYHHNDIFIKCMAYLEEYPTKEEIENFAYNESNLEEQIISKELTIYYNEDNEVNETNIEQSTNTTMEI